jgi:hypothetical protein
VWILMSLWANGVLEGKGCLVGTNADVVDVVDNKGSGYKIVLNAFGNMNNVVVAAAAARVVVTVQNN